jgi:hypothetical protein
MVPLNSSDHAEAWVLFADESRSEKPGHGEIQLVMLHRPQIEILRRTLCYHCCG